MTKINKQDLILLSAYVDGELSEGQVKQVERKLKKSPLLQARLKEMQEFKALMKEAPRLGNAPFFEEAVATKIEHLNDRPESNNKIFTFSGIAAGCLALVVVLLVGNSTLNDSNAAGSALVGFNPVFQDEKISNEDVFNFAFYNKLPINEGKVLELGSDDTGDEFVQIVEEDESVPKNSLKYYYEAMGLTDEEMRLMDSILHMYADMLSQKAIFQKDNKLALNANLWELNQALAADVMLFSLRANKGQFMKMVPVYTFEEDAYKTWSKKVTIDHNDPFLILTMDTLFVKPFELNISQYNNKIDSLQLELFHLKTQLRKTMVTLNDSLVASFKIDPEWNGSFKYDADSNYVYFRIPSALYNEELKADSDNIRYQLKEIHDKMEATKLQPQEGKESDETFVQDRGIKLHTLQPSNSRGVVTHLEVELLRQENQLLKVQVDQLKKDLQELRQDFARK